MPASTTTPDLHLENAAIRLAIDPASGTIRSAIFRKNQKDLFAQVREPLQPSRGYLRVFDEKDRAWYDDLDGQFTLSDFAPSENGVRFSKQFPGAPFTLRVTMSLDADFLTWQVEAIKNSPDIADRSLRVHFCLPLIAAWQLWSPCSLGQRRFDGMTSFEHDYTQIPYHSEQELTVPMCSHFSPEDDIGYTMLEPIDALVPAAKFAFNNIDAGFTWRHTPRLQDQPKMETINYFIGLVGDRPMKTQAMVHFHGGHWRSALGAIWKRWNEFFTPPNPQIYDMEGMFCCDGIWGHYVDAKVRAENGVKLFEAHGHFAYYSDYHSEGKTEWPEMGMMERVWKNAERQGIAMTPEEAMQAITERSPAEAFAAMGDSARKLLWRDGKPFDAALTPKEAHERIFIQRDELRRRVVELADAGVYVFWYFNYTDGWRPVAHQKWEDAICKKEDGAWWPSGWMMCDNLNADPRYSFGKFAIESAKKIIAEHPRLSGFFLDCFRHFEVDFAHDDGITVVNHRPAYSVNFSYHAIESVIGPMRSKAKLCSIANKPQTMHSMRWVDGMMIEGDGDAAELKYFWSAISKPIIFLFGEREGDDQNCRRAVVYGCYPKIAGSETEEKIARRRRYAPLYDQFRRRVFCFEPDPIRLPKGCRGELYTVGEDYVCGIANVHAPDDTQVTYTKKPWVTFRVERGHDVKKVGLLLPGQKEMKPVDFKFDGTFIAVPLDGFTTAAVVRLYVEGCTGKQIGLQKFTGTLDSSSDPDAALLHAKH